MNGKYQVGSGRIVAITHDTPFIKDIVTQIIQFVNSKNRITKKASMRITTRGLQLPKVVQSVIDAYKFIVS
jgi:hypothetical protein